MLSKISGYTDPMRPPDRVSELDGIRGIAILLVMFFHFGSFVPNHPTLMYTTASQVLNFGWCGVDLFFVLSGFLITGRLLDSVGSQNYFSAFYVHRALRILPVYYLAVFVFFEVVPVAPRWFGWDVPKISSTEQLWYWLHVSNWRTAFDPYVYPQVGHFWSLAIEEQFYLAWPLLVLTCSRRRLLQVCAGLILVCWLARSLPPVQALSAQYPNLLYRLTPFRIDSLVFGASAAVIVRDQWWTTRAQRCLRLVFVSGCIVISAVVVVAGTTSTSSGPMTIFGYTALGMTFTCAVLYATWNAGSAGIGTRILRNSMLTSFGKYSYAMYVVHISMMFIQIHMPPGHGSTPLTILARIGATYLVAVLSWICIERHFLRLKRLFPYRQISPIACAATN